MPCFFLRPMKNVCLLFLDANHAADAARAIVNGFNHFVARCIDVCFTCSNHVHFPFKKNLKKSRHTSFTGA